LLKYSLHVTTKPEIRDVQGSTNCHKSHLGHFRTAGFRLIYGQQPFSTSSWGAGEGADCEFRVLKGAFECLGSPSMLMDSIVYGLGVIWHGRGHRFDPDQVHQNILNNLTAVPEGVPADPLGDPSPLSRGLKRFADCLAEWDCFKLSLAGNDPNRLGYKSVAADQAFAKLIATQLRCHDEWLVQ
jgi:hypothetical protein